MEFWDLRRPVFIAFGIVAAARIILDRTEIGRYMYAIGGNPEAARLAGIPVAQQRLVMIARALVTQARLVVLDEPTGSLTDEETNHLFAVIRDLSAAGVAVVYVSHRLEEILHITDRVVVMRDGAVVDDRPTEAFDTRTLIEEITGEDVSETALQRRRSHGIGGPPDAPVVLEVSDVEVPDRSTTPPSASGPERSSGWPV